MTTTTQNTRNGIDLDLLRETVGAIADDPGLGACKFRASNRWLGANHNCTSISEFFGAKQVMSHRQAFDLNADEPPILAGNDVGPNPVEYLLTGLVSCMTTSMVAHASVAGIRIDALESDIEGDLDLQGFLGLDEKVAKGFTDIRVSFRVRTDAEDLAKLQEFARFSPSYNTLVGGTRISIDIRRM
jgi:uncharacterized OsmC-like protein